MFLSEKEYRHAVDLMPGREPKSRLLEELGEWFQGTFHQTLYDYICDQTNQGRLRLRILLWDQEAKKKMMRGLNLDEKKQKKIAKEFSALCKKYNIHREYQESQAIFVSYETLADEIRKRLLKQVSGEIQNLREPDVWRIEILFDTIHVFFETEDQRRDHEADGTCERIDQKMTDIVKKADKMGVFQDGVKCIFSSRQTLDEKYNGSMFYYSR